MKKFCQILFATKDKTNHSISQVLVIRPLPKNISLPGEPSNSLPGQSQIFSQPADNILQSKSHALERTFAIRAEHS